MSARESQRSRAARRLLRVPRCGRCEERPAEHVLVVPPMGGEPGFEMYSCVECWPALEIAIRQVMPPGSVQWCDCGRC